MKVKAQTVAAALAVTGVSAQTPEAYVSPSSSPAPVSYTTVTYDDCPTADIATMITVTNGVTVTYCPECEHPTTMPATTKGPGHTTVYTTTYLSLCPTGTVPVTYTVTETCEEETPTWTPGPSHVPQGFTVTVKECTVCDTTPVPVTITEPCDCEATSGTPVGPEPTGTPIEQISDGQSTFLSISQFHACSLTVRLVQNPGPTPGGDAAASTPGGGNVPSGPGSGSGDNTAPPYPTGTTTTVKCPGPECLAKATGGMVGPTDVVPISTSPGAPDTPSPTGSTSDMPPAYEGSAASYGQFGLVTSIVLSAVVGALAFAL